MFSDLGAAVPSLNPVLDSASKWSQYASGHNPQDYRGEQILTDDQHKAGGWEGLKPMLKWQMNQFGVLSALSNDVISASTKPSGERTENWRDVAVHLPVLNSFLGHSDMGLREQQWDAVRMQDAEEARFRLGLDQGVRDLVAERYRLDREIHAGALSPEDASKKAMIDNFYSHVYMPYTRAIRLADKNGEQKQSAGLRDELTKMSAQYVNQIKSNRSQDVTPVLNSAQ
jgi:hypothetical protein